MSLFLAIVGWTFFGLAVVVAMGLNLLGLFGNWVILGAVGAAWAITGFDHFGWLCLAFLLVLSIIGEVLEFVAASFGASKFGGSKGASWSVLIGAIAGAVLGSPLMPIIGTLIGACIGAFAAALGYEYLVVERPVHKAAWVGFGAALGKVAGLMAKFTIGIIMLIIAALMY